MDHRCLYGHRVSADFEFAVRNRVCPTCGATTITLNGYQLARELSEDVALDGVDAFKVALHLERNYTLTPTSEGGEEAAEGDDAEPEPSPAPDEGAQADFDDLSSALISDDPPEQEATTEVFASRSAAVASITIVPEPEPAVDKASLARHLAAEALARVAMDDDVEEPTVLVPPPEVFADDEIAPTLVSSPAINLAGVKQPVDSDLERSFFE